MMPYQIIGMGTYTNPSSNVPTQNVALTDAPDYFVVKDITNWGLASTAASQLMSEWYTQMAAGSYLQVGQASASAGTASFYGAQGSSNGFTFIDRSNPPVYTGLAATAINHSTGVVSMSNTGTIAVGDVVRVVNPVGMLQIGGLTFTVTAVTANTSITLGYNGVSLGSASATSATIVKLFPSQFVPKARIITNITAASQAVVTFATTHGYVLGEEITLHVPNGYGMTQINGQKGTVQAINTTNNTVTLNINSTGYTTFVYPASASIQSSSQNSPAIATPAGSGVVPNGNPPGTTLADAFDNQTQYYMNIGSSVVGAASAQMVWIAYKLDYNNGITNN